MGLVLAGAAAFSQNYWVVETDKSKTTIVKIYNSDNQLVNEKKVDRRIDVNKKRERRMLDKFAKEPVLTAQRRTS